MNVNDIIEPAEYYTGVDVEEDSKKIIIVNKAINRLNSLGLSYGDEEITVENEEYIELNKNVIGVSIVLDYEGNKFERWKFKRPNLISINKEGTFYVIYRLIADSIDDIEDPIPLHDIYLTPLIKYAEAFLKLKMHDNSPDGQRLMNHFERLATKAYNNLVITKMPANIRTSQILSGILAGTEGEI